MNLSPRYARRIHPFVRHELDAAAQRDARGEFGSAFGHLERAHVLAQASTVEHVRVHWAMFRWALRDHAAGEAVGQAWRIAGALLKTWLWVPVGNTGGAGVSGFRPMPVPPDLQRCIDAARRRRLLLSAVPLPCERLEVGEPESRRAGSGGDPSLEMTQP